MSVLILFMCRDNYSLNPTSNDGLKNFYFQCFCEKSTEGKWLKQIFVSILCELWFELWALTLCMSILAICRDTCSLMSAPKDDLKTCFS